MTDRTSNSTFDEGSMPGFMSGVASVYDNDTITLPKAAKTIVLQCSNDDDEIATAAITSGFTVTFGLVDDAGSGNTSTRRNIHWIAITDPQYSS